MRTTTNQRGWRLDLPSGSYALDRRDPGGPSPEGLRTTLSGAIELVADAQAIVQGIRLLLSTSPGERVMRPAYGCSLHRLLFAPNDGTTAGLAIHYVRQALARWEPRVEVLRVDANANPENPAQLDIVLEYRVVKTQHVDQLVYAFQTDGEQR